MNRPGPISEFLSQLRTKLELESRLSERIIAETEDHLLEEARQLYSGGLSSGGGRARGDCSLWNS